MSLICIDNCFTYQKYNNVYDFRILAILRLTAQALKQMVNGLTPAGTGAKLSYKRLGYVLQIGFILKC